MYGHVQNANFTVHAIKHDGTIIKKMYKEYTDAVQHAQHLDPVEFSRFKLIGPDGGMLLGGMTKHRG